MSHPRSLAVALLLAAATPLLAAEGDYDTTFTLNDVVSWNDGGDVTIADVAASDGSAYAVGSIELPAEVEALHWKGISRFGQDIDQGCAQTSSLLFELSTGGSGGNAALLDSTGNLVVGGWAAFFGSTDTRRALVARFDLAGPGCILDDEFSSNGWQVFDDDTWCDTEDCDVVDLIEQRPSTGAVLAPRIVALVRSGLSDFSSRFFLLGLNSSGTIDTSFGTAGWSEVTVPELGILFPEAHLAADATGRIAVLLTRYDPEGTLDLDVYALSFLPNGDLPSPENPLFLVDDGGKDDAGDPIGHDIAFGSNGAWLVSYWDEDETAKVKVVDVAAGVSGIYEDGTRAHQVVAQGDAKLVAAYDFLGDGLASTRRFIDTLVPLDFPYGGGSGKRSYDVDLGGSNSDTVAELILWSGRPLIAGTATDDSGHSGYLLRAVSNYVFADGFEQGTAALWSAVSGLVFPE